MISSTGLGPQISERIEANRNLFSALFLSSLGMLMHASFLWRHLTTLLTFLALLVAFKAIVTGVVLRLCGYPGPVAWATAIATAQIGEFSFVLLAKAKNVGYANRGYCHNFVQEKHSYKHRSTHIYIHTYIYIYISHYQMFLTLSLNCLPAESSRAKCTCCSWARRPYR